MSSPLSPDTRASTRLGTLAALLLCTAIGAADAQRPAPSTSPTQPSVPAPRPMRARRAATPSLGIFQGTTDVGRLSSFGPGAARYDARTRSYEVTGGGANMWGASDHFRYVWLRVSGDVAIEASVRFTDSQPDSGEAQPHRKACLIVRQTLDSSSAYGDAALHASGLTSLQWRDAPGAPTHEVQTAADARSPLTEPTRLRIEKRGDYVSMYVAEGDAPLQPSGGAAKVALSGTFYVGLGVTAHDSTRIETATFSDVRVERLAPAPATGAVISTIETISLRSRDRRVASVETNPAPVLGAWWYPDSTRTLFYRSMWEQLMRVQAELPGQPSSRGRAAGAQRIGSSISSCTRCEIPATGPRWSLQQGSAGASASLLLTWTEATSAAFAAGNADSELGIVTRWSPDGSAFVFASLKDNQIYFVPVRSREPKKLTVQGRNADPVFSPDGRYIYFSSDRSGRWQLWRLNVDGSAAERLTRDDFDDTHPYLSPDGRSVAFLSFEGATTNRATLRDARLRLLSLADGRIEELAKLLAGDSSLAAYPWSPDGQYLAFVSYQRAPR